MPNDHFVTKMELRYHDVLDWPRGVASREPTSPYPGHTPIYPNEESFINVLGEMCRDLKQRDLTAIPAFLLKEEGNAAKPVTPPELFHLIESAGMRHNHAMIMGVMLGLGESFEQFMAEARDAYHELHPQKTGGWKNIELLQYEDVHRLWKKKITEITPNYHGILGPEYTELHKREYRRFVAKPGSRASLRFPDSLEGDALLAYVRQREWSIGKFLEETRVTSEISKKGMSDILHIPRNAYDRFLNGTMKKVSLDDLDHMAGTFGAANERERIEWRKFILNYPAEKNQALLNALLSNGIDIEARGQARQAELSKFFRAMIECRGVMNRSQLALAVARSQGLGGNGAYQIQKAIHHVAGPEEDTAEQSHEKRHSRFSKVIPAEMAGAIARYAYPKSEEMQIKCVGFLASKEKYCLQEDELKKIKSAAVRKGWINRGKHHSLGTSEEQFLSDQGEASPSVSTEGEAAGSFVEQVKREPRKPVRLTKNETREL